MIDSAPTIKHPQDNNWTISLKKAYRSVTSLCQALRLEPNNSPYPLDLSPQFRCLVPQEFVTKMQADWNDPLLKQVIAQQIELTSHENYYNDPLQEKQASPLPGLIHKYHGRILWIVAGGCAINCRYCFRRHFPYQDHFSIKNHQKILEYISHQTSLKEVILSGGDPLMLDDSYLEKVITQITTIQHINTLRIHTRMPILIPSRITRKLIDILSSTRLRVVIVFHINHPNELDQSNFDSLHKLNTPNIQLLNQSVLLKGVNDHPTTLAQLSEKLFAYSILPYYIHKLDQVSGTHHFQIDESQANVIMQKLQTQLPGYLMPRYVQEKPGRPHKDIIHYG